MIKQFFILVILSNFLFAGIGTLRIIVDFGGKENISIKECSASKLDDFLFLNDNSEDTYGDLILNRPGLKSLYLCAPDIYNSTTTNIKYKDFKPSIILFNDQGIKAAPSLYNKKLLTSSSINTLILNYLYKVLNSNNTNISSLKDTYKQLSKFNINNFYLAIDYDSYMALNNSDKLKGFFDYLDSLPNKLKDDDISKKVFEQKVQYLKDLFKFSLDLYEKILPQYSTIKNNAFIDIWQSGFTKENFCQIDKENNFISSTTASKEIANSCFNCITNKNNNNFASKGYNKYISCKTQCEGIAGYSACISQGGNGVNSDQCFYDNCISDTTKKTTIIDDDREHNFAVTLNYVLYGNIPEALDTSIASYYNFKKIPYTNIKDGIIKDKDGKIDDPATNLNRNNICRKNIVNNLGNTFNYYSQKFKIKDITTLTFNLTNYPTLKQFYSILMDIHANLITNDISDLINDNINKDCISGDFDKNIIDGKNLNYTANKKLVNFVNVLKFNGNSFYNYSNKVYGLNMYSGYMPTIQPATENSLTGGIEINNDIDAGGGGLTNKGDLLVDNVDNSQCSKDESLLILFFDNLSDTLQNPEEINKQLNKILTNNENSNFFDVKNYQLYLGCYKKGYVTKFVGKLQHTLHSKDELLSCYTKWLNEPEKETNSTESSNTSSICLDYFYHDIDLDNLDKIYNKFDDKNNDLVVFGSIVHFNIYNSKKLFKDKLNGSPEIDEYTDIFQNIIPTIPYDNMILEKYILNETVCNITEEYSEKQKIDKNGTKIVDEYGKPVMEEIKGTINCFNNTSNQYLYNYQHKYNYETQDYMLMLNSYSPVKLSNINNLSTEDRNMLSINNEYKAFSTIKENKEIKDCPMLYFNPDNITINDYIEDNKYCLKYNYSDYNTEEKPFINNKFKNYIPEITMFAKDNGIQINQPITENTFFTYQFPADVAFLYKPAYNGDNDKKLYEINQLNALDIVNTINNTNNNFNVKEKTMQLAKEDNNIDLTKYNVTYQEQNINISNFSDKSMKILTDNNVITKE